MATERERRAQATTTWLQALGNTQREIEMARGVIACARRIAGDVEEFGWDASDELGQLRIAEVRLNDLERTLHVYAVTDNVDYPDNISPLTERVYTLLMALRRLNHDLIETRKNAKNEYEELNR